MNEHLRRNTDESYYMAEQEAVQYFNILHNQVREKTWIPLLTHDFQSWKQDRIHHPFLSLFSRGKGTPDSRGFYSYLRWLNHKGKLDHYLDRSISYIYMRDLGKALDSPKTQNRIRRIVESLKDYLTHSALAEGNEIEVFSMAGLYREAQKAGIESAMIWVVDKLKTVSDNIPDGMDADHAKRKLIKIIAGVLMHELEEMDNSEGISPEERSRRLDEAVRLGYSYGLTYPFIDDLLDADVLSDKEKGQFSKMIRTTLTTGSVPELGEWAGGNIHIVRYIHSELREAFEYIRAHQRPEKSKSFFEQAYIFFNAQEVDRMKDLSNEAYTDEELYEPVILKSASSRLVARSILGAPDDEGFDSRTFFYGIYNQLADDFTDMFDDMEAGSVTPYTYYMKYRDKRSDLINPFELYWTVISHLVHNVYHSDPKTREVILDRAINGLKRFKKRMGTVTYNEVMALFASGNPEFNRVIQKMVRKADDVDFFDKLLRDHILDIFKNERKEQEGFLHTIDTVRDEIEGMLNIRETEDDLPLKEPIIDAANYSLEGGGKRLRPIMTWIMGIEGYGLDRPAIVPLLRSLEYMHTASLIFDDLPSQDNASIRRGRPTLHCVHNTAIAELTGLFLTQKATEEQASLDQFDPKTVLNLIHYSARVTGLMCQGQAMDLNSKGKQLTLEQLNTLSFYKTGIAFEASLVMPAILANAGEAEMEALKTFAHHSGIAFQIKDDLLDVEGDVIVLGKPVGKDAENHSSTFVSILGEEAARKEMWEHYCLAVEALRDVPRNTSFFKQMLSYIVNRDY